MNIKQRITFSLGITIITLMGVFPPWKYVYDFPGGTNVPGLRVERPAGYHSIVSPPQIPDDKTIGQSSDSMNGASWKITIPSRLRVSWKRPVVHNPDPNYMLAIISKLKLTLIDY